MTPPFSVQLAQIPLIDGDVGRNLAKTVETIKRSDGSPLMIFPEATLSGFPGRRAIAGAALPLDSAVIDTLRSAVRRQGISAAIGLTEEEGGRYFITTLLIGPDGNILLRYRKTHLWSLDVGLYTPGEEFPTCPWNGMTVGLLICYDVEFPETARRLAQKGADFLIVTNGNMDPYGPVHRRALTARAMENQVFAAMANRCGSGAHDLTFPGESALFDPLGDIVAAAGPEETLLSVQVEPSKLRESRKHYRYLDDARL